MLPVSAAPRSFATSLSSLCSPTTLESPGLAVRGKPVRRAERPLDTRLYPAHPGRGARARPPCPRPLAELCTGAVHRSVSLTPASPRWAVLDVLGASLHFSPAICSIAVPDAILPRQPLLRCSTSATAPALLYLGNRSCVALPRQPLLRCSTSCIPAVVLDRLFPTRSTSSIHGVVHPWSRTFSAFFPELFL